MPGHDVYLVGSVPMADAEQVFERRHAASGRRIKRIPDGETGERGDWITWLEPVFADHPAFRNRASSFACTRAEPGGALHAASWFYAAGRALENLFYAEIAKASYAVFERMKVAGRIAPETKFQVDLVPAHSVIWLYLSTRCTRRSIRSTMRRSSGDRQDRSRDPAWSAGDPVRRGVCGVRAARAQSGVEPWPHQGGDAGDFSNILIDLGNRVPADIDLLYHLCYGDSNHRHVVEPTDMGDMVEFANRVARASSARFISPYAGAAQPRRRRLFRAVAALSCGRRPSCARARASHRRRRRH